MLNNSKSKNIHKSQLNDLLSIFKNKKVLIAIIVTLGILVFFRIGSVIPMPFVKINQSSDISSSNSFLQMMNLLGGGGLTQVSIFAIGISPYITAQIIVQLLSSDLIPPLARLTKSGEKGRRKLEVVTRVLTLPFAIVQGYAILSMISGTESFVTISEMFPLATNSFGFYAFYILLMIAGTYITILLSDLISKRGVGNGMTLIIITGILSSLFSSFRIVYTSLTQITGQNSELISVISFIIYLFFYIIVLIGVIFIEGSVRKIPIQQVGQSFSRESKELSYLPIKINSASVIPVIFASSFMTIPTTIAQLLPSSSSAVFIINQYISLNSYSGLVIYFFLIILFTFFYSYVQLNPNKISQDFKKSGRFIPGVKVGEQTENYISKILFRVNWIGGPFLALVATLPYIVSIAVGQATNGLVTIPSYASLGGTGIVIMVSGTIELWDSIRAASKTTSYSYQKKELNESLKSLIVDENSNTNNDSQLW